MRRRRRATWHTVVSIGMAALCASIPARLDAQAPGVEFHVDGGNPAASDRNPGTTTFPVQSVGRGLQLALQANARGVAATVLVHAGTYREAVVVPAGGTDAPLSVQATDDGKAVISGSDIWTGWTRLGTTPVFAHAWPYTWGLAPIPRHWPALEDILRRREMVFVGGQPLRQAVAPAPLQEGAFYVDQANHQIYVWPAAGADPNAVPTEVAVRPVLFAASGRAHLTVRGLVFEHAATPVDEHAVTFEHMRDLQVLDTIFRWNNWGGLGVSDSTNVAVIRSVANHNGARGMGAYRVKSVRYEDDDTSYNNWRGVAGNFTGWAAAGIKVLLVHGGVFIKHRAVANEAHGFWLDTDNEDISIDAGIWCDNRRNGALIEASQGPIDIAGTIVCHNGQAGVLATEASNLTIRSSALFGNKHAQFEVAGEPSDTVTNWETRHPVDVRAQNLTLCGNTIVGESAAQDLIAIPPWRFLLLSLTSRRNNWWNPQTLAGFNLRGSPRLDLSGWREASGQDGDSVYADPRFVDPVGWNVTPQEGDPWRRC